MFSLGNSTGPPLLDTCFGRKEERFGHQVHPTLGVETLAQKKPLNNVSRLFLIAVLFPHQCCPDVGTIKLVKAVLCAHFIAIFVQVR